MYLHLELLYICVSYISHYIRAWIHNCSISEGRRFEPESNIQVEKSSIVIYSKNLSKRPPPHIDRSPIAIALFGSQPIVHTDILIL